MEMCNVAGENCTRSRRGEVQLASANGIGYKLSSEFRFFGIHTAAFRHELITRGSSS